MTTKKTEKKPTAVCPFCHETHRVEFNLDHLGFYFTRHYVIRRGSKVRCLGTNNVAFDVKE
jgi:hypothetical protein